MLAFFQEHGAGWHTGSDALTSCKGQFGQTCLPGPRPCDVVFYSDAVRCRVPQSRRVHGRSVQGRSIQGKFFRGGEVKGRRRKRKERLCGRRNRGLWNFRKSSCCARAFEVAEYLSMFKPIERAWTQLASVHVLESRNGKLARIFGLSQTSWECCVGFELRQFDGRIAQVVSAFYDSFRSREERG